VHLTALPGRSPLVDTGLTGTHRWEDMQSYMFLFLLEYRRAWADDREAATFQFHTS
jgi:hypothetical protein